MTSTLAHLSPEHGTTACGSTPHRPAAHATGPRRAVTRAAKPATDGVPPRAPTACDPPATRVRVRPAPQFEPPYDDRDQERPPVPRPAAMVAGRPRCLAPMLPLEWSAHGPRPVRPVTTRQPHGPARSGPALVTAGTGPTWRAGGGEAGRRPTPGRVAAQRFASVCAEVLSGHRPTSHLRAVTTSASLPRVTDQLVRRTTRAYLARPPRSAPSPQQVRLRTIQVCEPRDGVAELAAVFEYAGRVWAMAARLERHGETWLCTLVEVI